MLRRLRPGHRDRWMVYSLFLFIRCFISFINAFLVQPEAIQYGCSQFIEYPSPTNRAARLSFHSSGTLSDRSFTTSSKGMRFSLRNVSSSVISISATTSLSRIDLSRIFVVALQSDARSHCLPACSRIQQ